MIFFDFWFYTIGKSKYMLKNLASNSNMLLSLSLSPSLPLLLSTWIFRFPIFAELVSCQLPWFFSSVSLFLTVLSSSSSSCYCLMRDMSSFHALLFCSANIYLALVICRAPFWVPWEMSMCVMRGEGKEKPRPHGGLDLYPAQVTFRVWCEISRFHTNNYSSATCRKAFLFAIELLWS